MILGWGGVQRGWSVASSGHPTAGGSFGDDGTRTFRDAFWSHVGPDGLLWVRAADTRVTYMFELCDQPNRIVVRHDRPRLVLHGARWLETGIELGREELEEHAVRMHCELVDEFPIGSVDACLIAAEALDPIRQEGFVVVDGQFNRVKIKSPRYVALHHLKGNATPRRAIELWQSGEHEELLAHFPEFRPGSDCEAIRLHKFTDRTVLVVDGSWSHESPAIGGAGIVLADGCPTGEAIGQRYCGFRCHGSQDAEYQAILRAHLWAPTALIYSDANFVVRRLQGYHRTREAIGRQVRYLRDHLRGEPHQIAHRLSVQGRMTVAARDRRAA